MSKVSDKKQMVSEDNTMEWTPEEKKEIPPKYGCEILVENANEDEIKSYSYPSDAYVVTYIIEDKIHMDLCRGNRINVFDLYYDKFGPNSIQKIDWGYGRVNPKLWGYKAPEKKKRK